MEDGFEPMTMRQLELTVRASSQPVLFKTAFKRDVEKERERESENRENEGNLALERERERERERESE